MTDNLPDWFRAQFDKDERIAREAADEAMEAVSSDTGAVFLPDSGSLPPWVRITAAVVIVGLVVARIWLSYRNRRKK
ncbi:hypothetical protein ACIQNU_04295 [Streptomyces sp. NPDC091292]|uniref:hypothetical protein n=1 Tax=Streptomyces sp. NPDC091292 TaxID=3365991 RepID=UPI0037F724EC